MDRETMRGLVSPAPVGRLATLRRDGRPHLVPICIVVTDDVVYSAVDDKPSDTAGPLGISWDERSSVAPARSGRAD